MPTTIERSKPQEAGAPDLSLIFKSELQKLTDMDDGYWDYTAVKQNSNGQAYFQYPAMMVPRMQGDIIATIKKCFPNTTRTFDPFAGSGTILVESLKQDLNSLAMDINPMAILLCKVKSQAFQVKEAQAAFAEVLALAAKDESEQVFLEYHNAAKWFNQESLIELSKIRRGILTIKSLPIRRLLWVAFAEAVRLSSNSRTSTYKLHIRDEEDRARRAIGVKARIDESMQKVLDMYQANFLALTEAKHLTGNSFDKTATVRNHDIRKPIKRFTANALISSPPYGDNHTTVTYGQHSFLPLSWIPIEDIDDSLSNDLLTNTHSIDSASLGGKRLEFEKKKPVLVDKSATLKKLLENPVLTKDAQQRLVYFFHDLDLGLKNAIAILDSESPIVLTLGNRCVSKQRVQTDEIVKELLESQKCSLVDTHSRSIPTKRMAHRNGSADTMLTETLLIMRSPVL